MNTTNRRTVITMVLIGSLLPVLCCGCGGLMLSPIYNSALLGGLVGGVIGYQSGEAAAGALLGAGITGTGELLRQTDNLAQQKERQKCKERREERIVVEVTNSNGSFTPVELRKKGCVYIGPKGEHYKELPSEEQLRLVYGF